MYWVHLLSLAALAAARQSPNADYVAQLKNQGVKISDEVFRRAVTDGPGLIAMHGYPIEVHNVVTSDGYILEAHRIPHGRDNNQPGVKRPIAFVMHGLMSSSADFFVLGPENSLCYVLAEAGYDVWFGNARGNFYSRKHITLDPNARDQEFWKFSWDEIGNYDIPAFVDYILATTGQQKLHYIGHSQGGTTFLVLASLRPEYNDKFISFQGLAPASFFTYNIHPGFQALAPMETLIESTAWRLGHAEIFPNRDFIYRICDDRPVVQAVCDIGEYILASVSYYNDTVILGHAPAGSSIRQLAHYAQNINRDAFRRYNHDVFTNLIKYGSIRPPAYNLSRITTPVYLHYGLSDIEVNFMDILKLARNLPNVVGTFRVGRMTFNHYDFLWGRDVKTILYDNLIGYMKDAENRFL